MEILIDVIAYLIFFSLFGYAVSTDIKKRTIPNWVIFGTVLLWAIWQVALFSIGANPDVFARAISACLVFAGLFVFTIAAEKLFDRYLFGGGDIKLVAASTLFLGVNGMLVAVFFACLVSLLYALAKLPQGIPFAPCMLCGSLIAMLI